jgi:magnesium-transporting ATPase (P-type)
VEIEATRLVPGDVVVLEAGNIIPADVRFFEVHQIKVDESSLTGESDNAEKSIDQLPEGEYALGDRSNIGFKGTVVTNGRSLAYGRAGSRQNLASTVILRTGAVGGRRKLGSGIGDRAVATDLEEIFACFGVARSPRLCVERAVDVM